MATPPPASPSVFQSLFGGGAAAATDTASATSGIAQITTQFSSLTSGLTNTLSLLSLKPELKSMIDMTGITGALNNIKELQQMCSMGDLSTGECAKKLAYLEAQSDAAKLKVFNDVLANQTKKLTKMRDNIKIEYDSAKAESDAAIQKGALVFKGASALDKISKLLTEINADIEKLKNSVPYVVPSKSAEEIASSASTLVKPPYELPSVKSTAEYKRELTNILNELDTALNNPFNYNRMIRTAKEFSYTYFIPVSFYVVLVISIILGGILCGNMSIGYEEDFLLARVWYFVHGMIGFVPIMIYSLIYPPYWVSGIFPLTPLTIKDITYETPPTPTASSSGGIIGASGSSGIIRASGSAI